MRVAKGSCKLDDVGIDSFNRGEDGGPHNAIFVVWEIKNAREVSALYKG